MTWKPKVLVFLREDFTQSHGGALWAKNMLWNMAQVPDMEFVIVCCGPSSIRSTNHEFVASLGFDYLFVPLREQAYSPVKHGGMQVSAAADALEMLNEKYYFMLEREFAKQAHVDAMVVEIVRDKRLDLIVVNDIWSSLLVRSVFSLGTPCCLISLDDELAYQRGVQSRNGPFGDDILDRLARWIRTHGNWIPNARIRRHVNWVHRQCAGIVVLTEKDLPRRLPKHVLGAVLPPLLRKRELRWSHRGNRSVFFVGNVSFFPNQLAVEWICARLAPELERIDARIRINIIGADSDQVRTGQPSSNVRLMGYSSKEEVVRHMTTDDLFIAPIANAFGAKLKLAECVAHGMPFLATPAAMSGLPCLTSVPLIDLDAPRAAARLVVEYVNAPEALVKLSQENDRQMQQASMEQPAAWSAFFRRCMRVEARPRDSFSPGSFAGVQ